MGGEWDTLRGDQRAPPCLGCCHIWMEGLSKEDAILSKVILRKDWTSHLNSCCLTATTSISYKSFFKVPVEQGSLIRRNPNCRIQGQASLTTRALLACHHHAKHLESDCEDFSWAWKQLADNSCTRTTKQERKVTDQWSVLNHDIHLATDPLPHSLWPASSLCRDRRFAHVSLEPQKTPSLPSILFNLQKIRGLSSFSSITGMFSLNERSIRQAALTVTCTYRSKILCHNFCQNFPSMLRTLGDFFFLIPFTVGTFFSPCFIITLLWRWDIIWIHCTSFIKFAKIHRRHLLRDGKFWYSEK